MNADTPYDDLIIRHLADALSRAEEDELASWVSASPENRAHYERLCSLWQAVGTPQASTRYNKDAAYVRFVERVQQAQARTRHNLRLVWRRVAGIAAMLAIIIGVTLTAYLAGQDGLTRRFADIAIEAPQGSRTRITLPDGSAVWLNAGSRLSYSQGFGMNDRNVRISGEGYFEVKHNAQAPFTVRSKDMEVTVLGTKFNFQDYPAENTAIVTLAQGSVSVSSRLGGTYKLTPNQRAVIDKRSGAVRVEDCTPDDATSWRNGIITLNGQTLAEIGRMLERAYNIKVTFSNPKARQLRFYGAFLRQEQDINEVMNVLSATGRISYTRHDNTIIIH